MIRAFVSTTSLLAQKRSRRDRAARATCFGAGAHPAEHAVCDGARFHTRSAAVVRLNKSRVGVHRPTARNCVLSTSVISGLLLKPRALERAKSKKKQIASGVAIIGTARDA